MYGGDAHGVVNEAVALVGQDKRTFAMKGLVNAILRKVADTGHEQWELLRAPRLPKWLRVPLVEAYGPERVAAIETVQFGTPPWTSHQKTPHRSIIGRRNLAVRSSWAAVFV